MISTWKKREREKERKEPWPLTHTIHKNKFHINCDSNCERKYNKSSRKWQRQVASRPWIMEDFLTEYKKY